MRPPDAGLDGARRQARVSLVGSDAEPDLGQGAADLRIYYGGRHHPPHHTELFTDHIVPVCGPS